MEIIGSHGGRVEVVVMAVSARVQHGKRKNKMSKKILWLGYNKLTPEIVNLLGLDWNPSLFNSRNFKSKHFWYIKSHGKIHSLGSQENEKEARKVFSHHLKDGCVEVSLNRKSIGGI